MSVSAKTELMPLLLQNVEILGNMYFGGHEHQSPQKTFKMYVKVLPSTIAENAAILKKKVKIEGSHSVRMRLPSESHTSTGLFVNNCTVATSIKGNSLGARHVTPATLFLSRPLFRSYRSKYAQLATGQSH